MAVEVNAQTCDLNLLVICVNKKYIEFNRNEAEMLRANFH